MARIRRILVKNCCYHLMTRGNQKQSVFKHEDDYLIYLMLLKKFKRKYKFKIYAYCLMPNHIHLAAEPEDPANLPKLMLALNRTYTKYFNQKYEKVGHLWQGRYKSRIIAKDDYLFGCLSYIEANPVRAGLATDPREYRWSSYKSRNLGEDHPILDEMTF